MNSNTQRAPEHITFFSWLVPAIIAGHKTITLRDYSESHYQVGRVVAALTLEQQRQFAMLRIDNVTPLQKQAINASHAAQEAMSLAELRDLIEQLYPNEQQLYQIDFSLISVTDAAEAGTSAVIDKR